MGVMKLTLLLDTHTWIWAMEGNSRLPIAHGRLIRDPANESLISAISVWETSIKKSLGKLTVRGDLLRQTLDAGFNFVSFGVEAAEFVAELPGPHRDPFDRALAAQAKVGGFTLLTSDSNLLQLAEAIGIDLA